MSYIRAGHDLPDFEGISNAYVFLSCGYNGNDDYVEDYNNDYEDNATFAQLLLNFIGRATEYDQDYKKKMKRVLAKKLNVKVRE